MNKCSENALDKNVRSDYNEFKQIKDSPSNGVGAPRTSLAYILVSMCLETQSYKA